MLDPKFWRTASDPNASGHDQEAAAAPNIEVQDEYHSDQHVIAGREDEVAMEHESDSESAASEVNSDSTEPISDSSSRSALSYSSSCESLSDLPSSDDDEQNPGLENIYEGSQYSTDEAVLLIMNLYVERKLDKKTLASFLGVVNKLLPRPNNMPKSEYLLYKYLEALAPPIVQCKEHFYCDDCLFYKEESKEKCEVCNSDKTKKFYELPIAYEIRYLFENRNLADVLDQQLSGNAESDRISDVCDGIEYKRVYVVVAGRYTLTLMLYTDGVQLAKGSDTSLWTLQFIILEVPRHLRFKYLVVCGIWLDDQHPRMNTFLKPFIESLKELGTTGVEWKHPQSELKSLSLCFSPVICADGPARAQIQNILSHGGRYSCHCCEQKTKKLPAEPVLPGVKKKTRRRVFTFEEQPAKLRTATRMHEHGKATYEQRAKNPRKTVRPVKGVKGMSIVTNLPGLDRSTCVYGEYMHLILGITKQFFKLWFHDKGDYSIADHQSDIDGFLESISPPDFISRLPRGIDKGKWKANEFRNFVFFYSLPALESVMSVDDPYFQHWMLFVISLYLMNQDSITENELSTAEVLIRMFLRKFVDLYKAEEFTYNLHQLLHLPLYTRRWGPMWATGAWNFESFNGVLARIIHGSKHQGKELINNLRIAQGVQLLSNKVLLTKTAALNNVPDIVLLNKPRDFSFNASDLALLASSNCKPDDVEVYSKVSINGKKFASVIYARETRRNNFTVAVETGGSQQQYGEIKLFLKPKDRPLMAILNLFKINHLKMFVHKETKARVPHIIPVEASDTNVLISIDKMFKVIKVGRYICLSPNKFEIYM